MMDTVKEIDDYLKYVKEHPKWINKKRKLLIKNVVMPVMKELEHGDIFFDKDQYYNCIKYCEANYYKLFPYQKFIYAFVFMYRNDIPVFPKIVILMGRGNGKDGLMVPLANYLQTPLYGVKNYNVELIANSESQIKDTFQVAYDVMSKEKFKGKFKTTKEEIKNLVTGSILRYNTSNAGTKDGKRPGCIMFNEFHAYENYKQINVFESAMGKVKHGREIIITTNGYVRDGPLDELLKLCNDILETGDNPLGYFPFICELDDIKEVDDQEAWHKANPSMEYMPILANQIMADYMEMQRLPSKRPEFLTKRMNMPARNEEQTVTSWDNILRCCYCDIEHKIPRAAKAIKGKNAIIGIDYADVRDFVSAGTLVEGDNGEVIWRQHTWICAQSPFFESIHFPILQKMGMQEYEDYSVVDEPVIAIDLILNWCEERMKEFNVLKITMDTYRYNLFKLGFEQRGISIEDKNNPNGIVRLVRRLGSAMGIIAPTIECMFSEGKIDYGPSAIMRWYTNNTCVTTDKYGNKAYGKVEPKLRKNDGFMAFLVAMFSKDLLAEKVFYI